MTAIERFFKDWYLQRQAAFNYSIMPLKPDDYTDFCFLGLSPHLIGHLTGYSVDLAVHYRETYWDSLVDFIATEQIGDGYYYCGLCTGYVEHYPTRRAFWEAHVFEEFLRWLNKEITTDRWVMLHESAARLVDQKGIEPLRRRLRNGYIDAFRVVV